ncbi:hypothetical protein JTE90_014717 [Oedothorax gibbosus]|uniref:Uncharacterized protein n=1 Tax=Oedothorax gibbosus TaxID=931172 RepID=A0AAV6USU8_9ARAC|nr:hypothetical protein JTE90_014717 [Oedothorax gibbosus]
MSSNTHSPQHSIYTSNVDIWWQIQPRAMTGMSSSFKTPLHSPNRPFSPDLNDASKSVTSGIPALHHGGRGRVKIKSAPHFLDSAEARAKTDGDVLFPLELLIHRGVLNFGDHPGRGIFAVFFGNSYSIVRGV